MKSKYPGAILFLLSGIFLLSGCASLQKQKNMELQGLRNQISVLDAQAQAKDDKISELEYALSRAQASAPGKIQPEVKSRPKVKDIQLALQKAGYDLGPIDGRMGRKTRQAIRAFQRANNLAVDGRVGKQTWSLLKDYRIKKIK